MRGVTTPTRRSMKQQTLLGMQLTPTGASPSAGVVSAAAEQGDGTKRTTRASGLLSPTTAAAATTATTSTATTPALTVTPTLTAGRGKGRGRATPTVVRTPMLRPRRASTTPDALAGLRVPYEQHTVEALRQECARRGLSIQSRDHGDDGKPTRSKTHYVDLLQEADMLAMFERQSQKKTARRTPVRNVRLAPPPVPIRVTSTPPAASITATRRSVLSEGGPVATLESTQPKPATTSPRRTASTGRKTGKASAKKKATVAPTPASVAPPSVMTAPAMTTAEIPVAPAAAEPSPPMVPIEKMTVVSAPPPVPSVVNVPTAVSSPTPTPMATPIAPKEVPVPTSTAEETKPAARLSPLVVPETVDLTIDTPTAETEGTAKTIALPLPAKPLASPEKTKAEVKLPPAPAAEKLNADVKPLSAVPSVTRRPPLAPAPPAVAIAPALLSGIFEGASTKDTPNSSSRARRGCRFRLINVVLSPDFNTRWDEMHVSTVSPRDVNAFWRDVHISFLCQNSFYDKVHFTDVLFENVTPNVIKNHTAQKLQQMWGEIVAMYRRAWNASMKAGEAKPFLDSCYGRLDVLYLHMALLLEPELHKIILSDVSRIRPPSAAPTNRAPSTAPAPAEPTTRTPSAAPVSAENSATKIPPQQQPQSRGTRQVQMSADQPKLDAFADSFDTTGGPRFVELQNPEMLPDWLIEDQAKTAAERGLLVAVPTNTAASAVAPRQSTVQSASAAKAKKAANPRSKKSEAAPSQTVPLSGSASMSSPQRPSPVKSRDMVLHASAINSIDDSASSDFDAGEPRTANSQPARRRAAGKRRRDPTSTDLVEVPSSRELVTHPHKRLHTAVTTTMTRSQEVMVPPDEFDVLHNRLRKVNESIDQCYRTLSNGEAILNDMHREDVESDLRFYMGIKKRIQEQLVMFMHGY